jgi:hypothetical protein
VAGSAIFGAPDADGSYRGVVGRMRSELNDYANQRTAA